MSDQGLVVAIDAERLLVAGAGADHAQPAVVVDERRLQADARELAEQIGLLGREAGAAEHRDRPGAVRLLQPSDLCRDLRDRLAVGHVGESRRRAGVAAQRRQQSVGMRALQVALDAFRTEHAAVERKLLPRLEADDFVVAHLELNAALLAAEAAVRLDQPIGSTLVDRRVAVIDRQMRAEPLDDLRVPELDRVAMRQRRPQRALRQTEQRPPAFRADLLIVRRRLPSRSETRARARRSSRSRTIIAERVGLVAAPAPRLLAARAGILVETDAELRRPLEHVEQLAERQPEQRDDHGDRMEDGEEVVGVALHPGVARGQHQAGDADREQQQQRQDVLAELLRRDARRDRSSGAGTPASRRR